MDPAAAIDRELWLVEALDCADPAVNAATAQAEIDRMAAEAADVEPSATALGWNVIPVPH